MSDYTLEEVIGFINSEIDDAYTESRAFDREMERRANLAKLYHKRHMYSYDDRDLADAQKAANIDDITDRIKLNATDARDYMFKKGRHDIGDIRRLKKDVGEEPEEREPGYYLKLQKEKNANKEELAKIDKQIAKLKKESVSNIYEAYCDDVIDADTAMDMILTIEASTSEALEKLKKSGEAYNNRIKIASDELEKKKSNTLSSIRDRHEKANKEIEDMKRQIDEALDTKDEEELLALIRRTFGKK